MYNNKKSHSNGSHKVNRVLALVFVLLFLISSLGMSVAADDLPGAPASPDFQTVQDGLAGQAPSDALAGQTTPQPHEHVAGEMRRENETAGTCTTPGSHDEVVYCEVCNTELSRKTVTDSYGDHSPGQPQRENEIPATCTMPGSHDEVVYCTVCGTELGRKNITDDGPLAGNTWDEGVVTLQSNTKNINAVRSNKTDAGVSFTDGTALTKTYGDASFTLTASATEPGTTSTDPNTGAWTWRSSDPNVATVESSTGSGTGSASIAIHKASGTPITITAVYESDTTYGTAELQLTVNPKQITVLESSIHIADKVYDGTATATVTGTPSLKGVLDADKNSVSLVPGTAAFENKSVGANKAISFSNWSLSGGSKDNYTLDMPAMTASITAKDVTIQGITADERPYEENNLTVTLSAASASISETIENDKVAIDMTNATGTMADANVGEDKPVTVTGVQLSGDDAGNYNLTSQPTGVTVTITKAVGPAAPHSISVSSSDTTNEVTTINHQPVSETTIYEFGIAEITGDPEPVEPSAWQTSPYFSNLKPGTRYRVFARVKETANVQAGGIVSHAFTTNLSVSITGTAGVGYTLTANVKPESSTYTYKWYRGSVEEFINGSERTWDAISDAKTTTYTPTADDIGKYLWLVVEKTITEYGIGITQSPIASHVHDFTYKAAGAVITATCAHPDCDLTNAQATLTIAKPLHETYNDRKDPAARIIDQDGIQGDAKVLYYLANAQGEKFGDELPAAPADSGTYRAEITLGTGEGAATASVVYEIAKADPSLTIPVGKEMMYTGQLQPLVEPGQSSDGTLQYALGTNATTAPTSGWSTEVPKGTDAKTYHIWYKLIGSSNYKDTQPRAVESLIYKTIAVTVTFKVQHGSWDKGGTAAVMVNLTGRQGEVLTLTADQIPAVGSKPADQYEAGSWDTTPVAGKEITADTTYTYSYAKKSTPQNTPQITYQLVQGAGAEYTRKSGDPLTFIFKRSENDAETFSHFKGVKYDGRWLTEDNHYTAKAGSVVIDMKSSFLDGLKAGDQSLTIVFDDTDDVEVAFKVLEAPTYKVTFNANGHGTAPAAQTVTAGNKAERPGVLTEQGYTFGGWYADQQCTQPFDFDTEITKDITLYAKWTKSSSGKSTSSGTAAPGSRSVPGTGDNNNTGLWIVLMVIALLAIFGIGRWCLSP